MVDVKDFKGSNDNEIIEKAIASRTADGMVVIGPREVDSERSCWLLDRAILLPENTTIILRNCKLKLSDKCRDNFFRTANCGLGIEFPEKIENVHIKGEGLCILEGADHPRAVGDGGKILACPCPYTDEDLCAYADWITDEERASGVVGWDHKHDHSYGTDALNPDESHYGDWRGIGVLFANVNRFSIENLRIVDSHGWGISLEACTNGEVRKIDFSAHMCKEIDGMLNNMENQDGVDIRNGCNNITISDITGRTGDDVLALTAIKPDKSVYKPGGSLCTTHVMHNDWTKRDATIHDITIRNIRGYSSLCFVVRLLPCNTKIYNIIIDGVNGMVPEGHSHAGCILLGEPDMGYGVNLPDSMSNITISNVISNSGEAIINRGYITNSVISNVISLDAERYAVFSERENSMTNVLISNVISPNGKVIQR